MGVHLEGKSIYINKEYWDGVEAEGKKIGKKIENHNRIDFFFFFSFLRLKNLENKKGKNMSVLICNRVFILKRVCKRCSF